MYITCIKQLHRATVTSDDLIFFAEVGNATQYRCIELPSSPPRIKRKKENFASPVGIRDASTHEKRTVIGMLLKHVIYCSQQSSEYNIACDAASPLVG